MEGFGAGVGFEVFATIVDLAAGIDLAIVGGGGACLVRYTGAGSSVLLTAPEGERWESRISRWLWSSGAAVAEAGTF